MGGISAEGHCEIRRRSQPPSPNVLSGEVLMAATTLGYVVVESVDPSVWRKFADTLGLMEGVPGPDGALRLRIDERPFRIPVRQGTQNRFVGAGWEFKNAASLAACLEGLREAGVAVRAGSAAETEARCVREIAFCADPCGNPLELYWGRAYDHVPFASPRGLSGCGACA